MVRVVDASPADITKRKALMEKADKLEQLAQTHSPALKAERLPYIAEFIITDLQSGAQIHLSPREHELTIYSQNVHSLALYLARLYEDALAQPFTVKTNYEEA